MKVPENNEHEEKFEHFNKAEHENETQGENEGHAGSAKSQFNFKDFSVEDIAEKVINYIKENNESVDKESLIKYAAVAVLGLYGLQKSGFLGSVLISGAVALIAKHFLLADFEKKTASAKSQA